MWQTCPFAFPPSSNATGNETDTLSSDVTLALKHAAVFIREFVKRCHLCNLFILTSLPVHSTSTQPDCTDVTSEPRSQRQHQRVNDELQECLTRFNQIDEWVNSFSARIDEQNRLFSNRIDDCVSRLATIQFQIAEQSRTQSELQHVHQFEISQNIAKLNELVVDLTGKILQWSNVKNELDELRKSIIQPGSMIEFKLDMVPFHAVPAICSLLDGIISYLTTRPCGNVHN
jgi:hypothetical protein